jgi:hypothetical protein
MPVCGKFPFGPMLTPRSLRLMFGKVVSVKPGKRKLVVTGKEASVRR